MSNKIGLILALVIFLESYLFMYDLYMVQLVNSKLVMSSNYVNALIIKEGGVNEEIYTYVEDEVNGKLYLDSDNYPGVGKTIKYTIVMDYYRLYKRSVESMSISRSVLLGYTLN
jgi:hypothetical protein